MAANATAPKPIEVFYDGACPLCSREAGLFARRAPQGAATFVDIAAPGFDAGAHGLDDRAVNKQIHAKTADGRTVVGVDALAEMWQLVPSYRWLARLTKLPVSRQVMQAGYILFARLRPYLPGRKPVGPG
jgi:predicted DCC family thiol-disulfide oxidoreductase YuxK